MPLRYQDVSFGDLGGGIDQLSPENKIPEGFSEYLKNVDPTPNGSLKKRVGYQLYGALPARVAKIRYTNEASNNICFYLDAAVNVLNLKSTPILVYGRTSEVQTGDFTNQESSHYYTSLVVDVKKEVAPGASSTIVLEGDAHAQGNIITGLVARSTSTTNLSNEQLLGVDQNVTKTTANLNCPITNGYEPVEGLGPIEQSFFMVAKRRSSQSGISYVVNLAVPTGTHTYTYTAATHNLASYSLGVELYLDIAGEHQRLFPDELNINSLGDVSFTLTNNYAGTINLKVAIFTLPSSNVRTFTLSALQNLPFQLPINKLEGKFPIFYIYRVDNAGLKHLVFLDSLTVDDPSSTATAIIHRLYSAEIEGGTPEEISLEFLWDYAELVSNEVCVTGSAAATPYTDESPQLTIWGLPQAQLYGGNPVGNTPGWVSHLDVYRATLEERAIAGLGGNLFAAYEREETPAVYGLPIYYPSLRGRVDQQVTIGPIITATNPASLEGAGLSPRTNGNIYCAAEIDGNFDVTSITWVSGNVVEYCIEPKEGQTFTLYKPGNPSPTISDVVTTDDYLSVGSMGHDELEGDFRVSSVSQSGNKLYVRVVNSKLEAIRLADPFFSWNFSYLNAVNTYGRAGFFTDSVPLLAGEINKFLEGDTLLSTAWNDDLLLTVTGINAAGRINFLGIDENLLIPDGLQFAGIRTSSVLPLRELTANRSVTNVVVGDVLHYTGATRDFRAKHVNAFNDETITIVGDGETATVTLSTLNTKWIEVGQHLLIVQAGAFSGEQEVTDVGFSNTFQFASTFTGTVSGVLLGRTVEIDEEYTWQDNPLSETALEVVRRWLPIETPTNIYNQLSNTQFRHLTFNSYASQPSLRSSMVSDTMYFTNGDDAVMRFDGANITRAGLERWQAGLFITADSSTAAKILDNSPSWTSGHARAEATFRVSLKDAMHAAQYLNQRVKVTDTNNVSQIGRIKNVTDDGADGYIELDFAGQVMLLSTSSSANFTLKLLRSYKYYYRLNLFDANNNIISSAVTGNEDFVIEVAGDCSIRHTLQRPHWIDLYDYARIEVEVYRTKANSSGPFYRITTLKPSWNNSGETYLQYVDVRSDNDLLDTDWDAVNTSLLGQELGTTWSGPLRAKYITSSKGRLILANVRSWPKINLDLTTTTINATAITSSLLADKRFLLRKSNTDIDSITDNINRMGFEFKTNGRVVPSALAINTSTGVMTITSNAHGLVAGDWVYLFRYTNNTNANPRLGGHYQVDTASTNTFTVQIAPSIAAVIGATPAVTDIDSYVTASAKSDVPVWLGTDHLLQFKEGNVDGPSLIMNRLANAINCAQNVCRLSGFKPWVTAQSDRSFRSGSLSLETNYVSAYTLELVLPSFSGFSIYANGLQVSSGEQIQAIAQRFPSRLLISYPNYAEIFDAPTAASDSESESAIDVNPSDGQEITGVIPFFGESAFGSAQKDGILLVFKTASAYLVNISAKVAGQNAVQKLDTRGLGCTAPYSIAPTQNGIMFANKSGIYRITTSLDLQYIGKRLERVWKESVDSSVLEEQTFGHYYPKDNYYKLSVPYREDELAYPNRTLVYNTVREYSPDGYRDGSWTSYEGIPAVGWANMLERSLFASPKGEVFTLRQAGDAGDYRDDGKAIDAEATLRAMDFGSTGIRKSVSTFALQFKTSTENSDIIAYSSIDLRSEWEVLDPAKVSRNRAVADGLGTQGINKVSTIQFTSNSRKGVYYQIKVRNNSKDQGMELAGVSAMVAALTTAGVMQAAESTR